MSATFGSTIPLLFVMIAISGSAQTKADLTARYGYPDVQRFVVRPGITLTAGYAENRTACQMLIEPEKSLGHANNEEQSMATETVTAIIDELIPKPERGILLEHAIENMGAAELRHFVYQNLTISRQFVRYLPKNRDETTATIIRKDGICGSPTTSHEYASGIELTAIDLQSRYGDPIAERYIVRPGVTAMVTYGSDDAACHIVIESQRPLVLGEQPRKNMASDVVDDIIEATAPSEVKGAKRDSLLMITGCAQSEMDFFENLTISRVTDQCLPLKPEREQSVRITFNRQACHK